MHFCERLRTPLATNQTIIEQLTVQTNREIFVLDGNGHIKEVKETNEDLPSEYVTIPLKNQSGYIRGINENVFTPSHFNKIAEGDTIKIEFEAIEGVHPTNFRNELGEQCYHLIMNPNLPTYKYMREMGYDVKSDGTIPLPTTPSKMLVNNANGELEWIGIGGTGGVINITETTRIRGIDGVGIAFELLDDGEWIQLTKMVKG